MKQELFYFGNKLIRYGSNILLGRTINDPPEEDQNPDIPSGDEDFDIVIENITNNKAHIHYWGGGSVYAGDGEEVFFKFKTNNFKIDEYGDKFIYINKLIVNDRDYLDFHYSSDLDNGKLKLFTNNLVDDSFEVQIGTQYDFEENEIIHININNQNIDLVYKTIYSELELCSDAEPEFTEVDPNNYDGYNYQLKLPIDWPVRTYGGFWSSGENVGNREKYGFDLNEFSWIQLSYIGVEVYKDNNLLFDTRDNLSYSNTRYTIEPEIGDGLFLYFKKSELLNSKSILIKPYHFTYNYGILKKYYCKPYNFNYEVSDSELSLTIENPYIDADGYINFQLNLSDSDGSSEYRYYEPPTLKLYVNNKKTDYWYYDDLYWDSYNDYSYDNSDEVKSWFKSDKIDLKVIATFSDGKTITATESITYIPNLLDGAELSLRVDNYNNDGSYYVEFDSSGNFPNINSNTNYTVYVDSVDVYTSEISECNNPFGDRYYGDCFYSSDNGLDNLTAGEHTFKVILHTEFGDIESEEVTFDITVNEEE